jgi:thiol-disulfide isomerase/thioredoxin
MKTESRSSLARAFRAPATLYRRGAALACLLAAVLTIALAVVPVGDAKVKVGKMPKESVAQQPIDTLSGQTYTLAGLRGKVVVLDFFGDWCAHSREHSRALARYTDEDFGRGLQIIGQAVEDDRTNAESVRKYVADQQVNYPVGLTTDRKFMAYVESRDLSVPQTLVYGRDGKLVAHTSGHGPQAMAELSEAIRRELDKK